MLKKKKCKWYSSIEVPMFMSLYGCTRKTVKSQYIS